MLAGSLDLLLVGRWLPPPSVGLYALAGSLAGKADLVNQSLHTVLLPAASALDSPAAVRGYVRQSLRRSLALTLLLLPLLPLAGPLIGLFYGPAFLPAADIFRLLLGVALFDVWATPLLLLVYSADRPRLLAATDLLRVAALVACGAGLIPALGLAGAALARLCSRVAGAALILLALRGRAHGTPPPGAPPSPES
jgi:stage V sporulation protein B